MDEDLLVLGKPVEFESEEREDANLLALGRPVEQDSEPELSKDLPTALSIYEEESVKPREPKVGIQLGFPASPKYVMTPAEERTYQRGIHPETAKEAGQLVERAKEAKERTPVVVEAPKITPEEQKKLRTSTPKIDWSNYGDNMEPALMLSGVNTQPVHDLFKAENKVAFEAFSRGATPEEAMQIQIDAQKASTPEREEIEKIRKKLGPPVGVWKAASEAWDNFKNPPPSAKETREAILRLNNPDVYGGRRDAQRADMHLVGNYVNAANRLTMSNRTAGAKITDMIAGQVPALTEMGGIDFVTSLAANLTPIGKAAGLAAKAGKFTAARLAKFAAQQTANAAIMTGINPSELGEAPQFEYVTDPEGKHYSLEIKSPGSDFSWSALGMKYMDNLAAFLTAKGGGKVSEGVNNVVAEVASRQLPPAWFNAISAGTDATKEYLKNMMQLGAVGGTLQAVTHDLARTMYNYQRSDKDMMERLKEYKDRWLDLNNGELTGTILSMMIIPGALKGPSILRAWGANKRAAFHAETGAAAEMVKSLSNIAPFVFGEEDALAGVEDFKSTAVKIQASRNKDKRGATRSKILDKLDSLPSLLDSSNLKGTEDEIIAQVEALNPDVAYLHSLYEFFASRDNKETSAEKSKEFVKKLINLGKPPVEGSIPIERMQESQQDILEETRNAIQIGGSAPLPFRETSESSEGIRGTQPKGEEAARIRTAEETAREAQENIDALVDQHPDIVALKKQIEAAPEEERSTLVGKYSERSNQLMADYKSSYTVGKKIAEIKNRQSELGELSDSIFSDFTEAESLANKLEGQNDYDGAKEARKKASWLEDQYYNLAKESSKIDKLLKPLEEKQKDLALRIEPVKEIEKASAVSKEEEVASVAEEVKATTLETIIPEVIEKDLVPTLAPIEVPVDSMKTVKGVSGPLRPKPPVLRDPKRVEEGQRTANSIFRKLTTVAKGLKSETSKIVGKATRSVVSTEGRTTISTARLNIEIEQWRKTASEIKNLLNNTAKRKTFGAEGALKRKKELIKWKEALDYADEQLIVRESQVKYLEERMKYVNEKKRLEEEKAKNREERRDNKALKEAIQGKVAQAFKTLGISDEISEAVRKDFKKKHEEMKAQQKDIQEKAAKEAKKKLSETRTLLQQKYDEMLLAQKTIQAKAAAKASQRLFKSKLSAEQARIKGQLDVKALEEAEEQRKAAVKFAINHLKNLVSPTVKTEKGSIRPIKLEFHNREKILRLINSIEGWPDVLNVMNEFDKMADSVAKKIMFDATVSTFKKAKNATGRDKNITSNIIDEWNKHYYTDYITQAEMDWYNQNKNIPEPTRDDKQFYYRNRQRVKLSAFEGARIDAIGKLLKDTAKRDSIARRIDNHKGKWYVGDLTVAEMERLQHWVAENDIVAKAVWEHTHESIAKRVKSYIKLYEISLVNGRTKRRDYLEKKELGEAREPKFFEAAKDFMLETRDKARIFAFRQTANRIFLDLIDYGKNMFEGPTTKIFGYGLDENYSRYYRRKDWYNRGLEKLAKDHGRLSTDEDVSLYIHAVMQQPKGEDYILAAGGRYGARAVEKLKRTGLNDKQKAYYKFYRESLDDMHPDVKFIAGHYFGENVEFVKDYFPIKMEMAKSPIDLGWRNFGVNTPGAIKTRRGPGFGNQIKIGASEMFSSYIDHMSYFVEVAPYLKELRALLSNPEFAETIGNLNHDMLTDYVNRASLNFSMPADQYGLLQKFADFTTKAIQNGLLTFSLRTLVVQPTSIIMSFCYNGFKNTVDGLFRATDPESIQWLRDNFPAEYARRQQSVYGAERKIAGKLDVLGRAGFAFIGYMDSWASWPAVFAAYARYCELHGEKVDFTKPVSAGALNYVHDFINTTQGPSTQMERSAFVTGGKYQWLTRNAMVFKSYSTAVGSLLFRKTQLARHHPLDAALTMSALLAVHYLDNGLQYLTDQLIMEVTGIENEDKKKFKIDSLGESLADLFGSGFIGTSNLSSWYSFGANPITNWNPWASKLGKFLDESKAAFYSKKQETRYNNMYKAFLDGVVLSGAPFLGGIAQQLRRLAK